MQDWENWMDRFEIYGDEARNKIVVWKDVARFFGVGRSGLPLVIKAG